MMRIVNGNIDEFGMGDGFGMFCMVMMMTLMMAMTITLVVTMMMMKMMMLPSCIVALRSAHLVKAFKLHSAAQTKGF